MTDDDLGEVWVCTDCYFAHHYGAHEHEGVWYAGESDSPCEFEPLGELPEYGYVSGDQEVTFISDWTDSDTGDGIEEFTWRSCDGCGSHLGGSRYRLAIHWSPIKEEA
ncbi:MAG: hypothetical protein H0W42_12550 [Gemmatimonadaceae bacterium]|nr:hypothetical protein [Gemmatimonadaceae bacterium]